MTKEMGAFEDTLIENTLGIIPGFMKVYPEEPLVHERTSRKSLGEIDLERERYLFSTDEMLEEMLCCDSNRINKINYME